MLQRSSGIEGHQCKIRIKSLGVDLLDGSEYGAFLAFISFLKLGGSLSAQEGQERWASILRKGEPTTNSVHGIGSPPYRPVGDAISCTL